MFRIPRIIGAAALSITLLFAAPEPGTAQYRAPTNTADISVYGGYDIPTLDLADAASAGPMAGVSVGYRLHEQVTLRFDGNAAFLGSEEYPLDIEGPSMDLYRFTSGIEVNLFDPKLTSWRLLVNGGLGWSFLSSDDLPESRLIESTDGISTDGLAVRVGAKIAYPLSESVLLYLGGDGYFHDISGGQDTRNLQRLNMSELGSWDPSWTIPVSFGLRFSLN